MSNELQEIREGIGKRMPEVESILQFLADKGLAIPQRRVTYCEGIKCEYMEIGTDEDGDWVTCTADKCPYTQDVVGKWYKAHHKPYPEVPVAYLRDLLGGKYKSPLDQEQPPIRFPSQNPY